MQDNNFVDAFKTIKPTKEEREEILKNLFNHSPKRKNYSFLMLKTCALGVFTFGAFFLYNLNVQEVPDNRLRIMPINLTNNEISYNGKCYMETSNQNKKIGTYLGMIKRNEKNCLLHAHEKDNKIVFLFCEGNYLSYEEVVCK